jgi:hypothetical protein
LLFAKAGLNHNFPIYAFCNSWDDRHMGSYPAFSVEMCLSDFLLRLTQTLSSQLLPPK